MARVTAVLVVVASLTAAVPAARAAGGCEVPKHAHVKATSRHAVAYRAHSRVFACSDRDGDTVLLERVGKRPNDTVTHVGPIVLAGSHVAYAKRNNDGYSGYVQVIHVDLRHPGRREKLGARGGVGPPTVGRIVLAPDGALAYTMRWVVPEYPGTHEYRAVVVVDELGFQAITAHGLVDMKSLVRRHRVVSWTEDGKRRSTRFRELGKCTLPDGARFMAYRAGVVAYKLDDGQVYACIGRTGQRQLIEFDEREGRFEYSELFRIGGHFVGWTKFVAQEGAPDRTFVRLFDLDRRRVVREIPVESKECPGDVTVSDLAVARNGDLAWIALTLDPTDYCSGDPRLPSVNVWDACGESVLDDDDRAVWWDSLRIAGRQVRWTVSGEERSAELRSVSDC
jgi:hypothetical protein